MNPLTLSANSSFPSQAPHRTAAACGLAAVVAFCGAYFLSQDLLIGCALAVCFGLPLVLGLLKGDDRCAALVGLILIWMPFAADGSVFETFTADVLLIVAWLAVSAHLLISGQRFAFLALPFLALAVLPSLPSILESLSTYSPGIAPGLMAEWRCALWALLFYALLGSSVALERTLVAVTWSAVVLGSAVIVGYFLKAFPGSADVVAAAIGQHIPAPTLLAAHLLLLSGLSYEWMFAAARPWARTVAWSGTALTLVAMALSQNLSVLGVTLMMLVGVAGVWWSRVTALRILPLIVAIAASVVVAAMGQVQHARPIESHAVEIGNLAVAADLLKDRPLFGIGKGNWPSYYSAAGYTQEAIGGFDRYLSESVYIPLIAENGLIGFIVLASLIVFLWSAISRAQQRSVDLEVLGRCMKILLSGITVAGLFAGLGYVRIFQSAFFMVGAIAFALPRIARHETEWGQYDGGRLVLEYDH